MKLYSKPLLDGQAPRPIYNIVPSHHVEKAHLSCLIWDPPLVVDPDFMVLGKGRNVGQAVNRELFLLVQLSLHYNKLVQHPDYKGSLLTPFFPHL